MKSIPSLIALAVIALAVTAKMGAVRADDAHPNLILNGNFEQINGNIPAIWKFGSANPEIFKTDIVTEPEQGHALKLTAWNNTMSGYWAQQIAVKPNTTYLLSARVKISSGKILIYVTGGSGATALDARIYVESLDDQPLVPLFWKPEWATGTVPFPAGTDGPVVALKATVPPNQWTTVNRTFQTGSLNNVAINLGAFFATGEYWFDDVSVTEVTP